MWIPEEIIHDQCGKKTYSGVILDKLSSVKSSFLEIIKASYLSKFLFLKISAFLILHCFIMAITIFILTKTGPFTRLTRNILCNYP